MSEAEKKANESLAKWLFAKAMDGKPGDILDVGASYPWLAHTLAKDHGCYSYAADPSPELAQSVERESLKVAAIAADFEHDTLIGGLRLLIFVHTWEHLYDPMAAFRKCHELLAKDGSLFIRMPDHTVAGYERDLTEGHYSIHPFYYCFASVLELCYVTRSFVVEWTGELHPGQRDILLRPT